MFELHKHQKGQAIVYVLVFLPVVLLSVLMVYNSGKLTDDKVRLQNAADATAFSISTLEARDLNFTAYMNRGMMGNEVALAQLVGLYSWFDMVGSSTKFFDFYIIKPLTLANPATLGSLTPVITVLTVINKGILTAVNAIKPSFKTFVKFTGAVIGGINAIYSHAQKFHHMATIFLSFSIIEQVIGDNADDAKLSDFGWIALLSHMASYYYFSPLKVDNTFVQRNNPESEDNLEKLMKQHYAATLNAARDDYSKNLGGGFDFVLFGIPEIYFKFAPPIKIGTWPEGEVTFDMGIDLSNRGGTDLRFKEVSGKEYYSWTAVDISAIVAWFLLKLSIDWCFGFEIDLLFTSITVKKCISIIDVTLDRNRTPPSSVSILGGFIDFELNLKPQIDIPYGIGTGQFASSKGKMNATDMYGVDGGEYGNAPGYLPVTYNYPLPFPDWGVPMNMQQADSLISNKHKGLPEFNSALSRETMDKISAQQDLNGVPEDEKVEFVQDNGFFAPYLVIGLVKEQDDIRSSDKVLNTDSNTSGTFHLDNDLQDDELAAIAKSEVYFKRPTDNLASHFSRADGDTEYGSTYNPFWQSRLVNTEISDRMMALLIQQKQIWPVADISLSIPGIGTLDLNDILHDMGLI